MLEKQWIIWKVVGGKEVINWYDNAKYYFLLTILSWSCRETLFTNSVFHNGITILEWQVKSHFVEFACYQLRICLLGLFAYKQWLWSTSIVVFLKFMPWYSQEILEDEDVLFYFAARAAIQFSRIGRADSGW